MLDLKGILPEDEIVKLMQIIIDRGGYVKDLHGQKNMYYQVNATYYSALGEDDRKLLFARAVQIFMPGIPQVWYLDLFAEKNDIKAIARAGAGGHKEINRTNLSPSLIEEGLKREVVKEQLNLLRFRNTHPAFGHDTSLTVSYEGSILTLGYENKGHTATLKADFSDLSYTIYQSP